MQLMLSIAMEQVVFVDPNIAFSIDLSKRVKVELSHQRLESIVPKVLRQRFRFQALQIGSNDKGVAGWGPL